VGVVEVLGVAAAFVATWLLTYLIHSSVLIGGAVALHRWGRVRRPTSLEALWRFALVAGLLTASVAVWVGRGSGGARHRTIEAELVLPSPSCVALLLPEPMGVGTPIRALRAACGPGSRLRWYHLLTLLWLVGAAAALLALGRARRAWRDVEATLSPAGPEARALLEAILEEWSLAGVRLHTSPVLDAPCVTPSAEIALPERCVDELDEEELRAVLAHEVAHIARRDVWVLAAARLLTGLFWIQPLNRLAIAGMSEAAELACDEMAVRFTGRPLGLARSIMKVAEWTLPSTRRDFTLAVVGRRGGSLADRVRRILSSRGARARTPRWRRALVAAALLMPLLIVPSVPMPARLRAVVMIDGDVSPAKGGAASPARVVVVRRVEWRVAPSR
jgi:bla regulator protein blaR1